MASGIVASGGAGCGVLASSVVASGIVASGEVTSGVLASGRVTSGGMHALTRRSSGKVYVPSSIVFTKCTLLSLNYERMHYVV